MTFDHDTLTVPLAQPVVSGEPIWLDLSWSLPLGLGLRDGALSDAAEARLVLALEDGAVATATR